MNKLIFRKLTVDILTFFLLSSLAITSIVWVIQAVNLLDIVSEQGHGLSVYFFYTSLNLPKIFSKLLIFCYFLTLFVILNKYEDNNEILIFWINGITKISFINFIGKISLIFVFLQLLLNLFIVPYTQNLKLGYLKSSSLEFFPKLIQEKRFSNVMKNLTIFIEENNKNGTLSGIYIKEKINKHESKIIVASEGRLLRENNKFSFKLFDGNITNIDKKGNINLKFKETTYGLTKLNSKMRPNKINETDSATLFLCLEKFLNNRKNNEIRCEKKDSFIIKHIYEELFKRTINPIYIVIVSLISSLLIIKPKINFLENYFKFFLFLLGFAIILFSELTYKFISLSIHMEFIFLFLPIIFVIIFYITLLFKTKFNMRYL